jgi:hypothetical protein
MHSLPRRFSIDFKIVGPKVKIRRRPRIQLAWRVILAVHQTGRHFGPPPFWKADHAEIMPRHRYWPMPTATRLSNRDSNHAPEPRVTPAAWMVVPPARRSESAQQTNRRLRGGAPPSYTHYTHTTTKIARIKQFKISVRSLNFLNLQMK